MPNLSMDTALVPESDRPGPLPEADYPMIVEKTEIKSNKAGNGTYLEAVLAVVGGSYKGRKVWGRFTVTHDKSDLAVSIGRRMIADLCLACGKQAIENTEELHGIPITVGLKISQQKGYDPSNEIRKFHLPKAGNVPMDLQQSVRTEAAKDDPFRTVESPAGDNAWP